MRTSPNCLNWCRKGHPGSFNNDARATSLFFAALTLEDFVLE
jgi:hypothetical protein